MLSIKTYYNGAWMKIADFYHTDVIDDVILNTVLAIEVNPWIPHDLVVVVREETGEIIWDNDESYQDELFFNDPDEGCDHICSLCPCGDECSESTILDG